jgi:ribosomal-protein-alanine N-acetyltransferase
MLRGPRVLLRRFHPDDTDDVFEYASDPEVTRAAGWEPHRTPFDSMAYIQRVLESAWGPTTFAVEHIDDGRVVGVVDIRVVSRLWGLGEIGYTLSRSYWGRGLNTEAGELLLDYGFSELRLRRIRAECDPGNRRSYRTMEKLGMAMENNRIVALDRTGRHVERVCYSLLRADWSQRLRRAA